MADTTGFDVSVGPAEFRQRHLAAFWQRRWAELAILCRIVTLENPQLASACGLRAAHRRLRSAAGRGNAESVLRAPELLQWINVARYLVLRDMHRTLPTGHVRDHFGDLRRFAFAAACAGNISGSGSAVVQQDGRVPLPGLGLVLFAGRHNAGRTVRLRTDGATVVAMLGTQEAAVALGNAPPLFEQPCDALSWGALPRLGWGIILSDAIELSRPHCVNNPAWKIRPLDPDGVVRWRAIGQQACDLIAAIEQRLWIPTRDVLATVAPLESPPQVNLSGTCDDVLGCICTSLSVNAGILAETFVHEAAHVTLNMLSDVTSCWRTDAPGRLYRSPWRKDLRPISGMVHGIFAFLAVGEFWAALLACDEAGEFGPLGRLRLRTATRQVERALAELLDAEELTEAGRALLTAAGSRVQVLGDASQHFAIAPADASAIEERMVLHDAALPAPPPHAASSHVQPTDAAWSQKLGTAMPPPENHRSLRLVRRESLSDGIHRAAASHDAVIAEWEELAHATAGSEPESALLVQGSISYGRAEFPAAVQSYATYVERRWDDMDAWRLLAAALRRAGRHADALAIAFDFDCLLQADAAVLRKRFGAEWPFHLHEFTGVGAAA
jgi:HEXXH motif-containing protein